MLNLFKIVTASCFFNVAFSFSISSVIVSRSNTLEMKGKSLAEKGMSKKKIFQTFKEKVNVAVLKPDFFDDSDNKEIKLYCKSNKDGKQIGDCPFTQFIQLVLLKKNIPYEVIPTNHSIPDFIMNSHSGKLPVLVHKGSSMDGSLAIAEYIEKTFPSKTLTRPGALKYTEVLEKSKDFFPALKSFLTNTEIEKEDSLATAVHNQLDILDQILLSTPGKYFCGIELTLADLYLLPQLFHAYAALDHFKKIQILGLDDNEEPTRFALETYMQRMFKMPEFNDKKAYYNVDAVVYGWKCEMGISK